MVVGGGPTGVETAGALAFMAHEMVGPVATLRVVLVEAGPRLLNAFSPRSVTTVTKGQVLQVQAPEAFRLHWTRDEWQTAEDTPSSCVLGTFFVDIHVPARQTAPLRFTFGWLADDRWEGHDYVVEVVAATPKPDVPTTRS